jgi:tetratricopeptide (TPR) repeat protein
VKSYVLYKDWSLTISQFIKNGKLSHAHAGMLLEAILDYQLLGNEEPELPVHLLFLFNPLVDQFKRDEEKYIEKVERNKKNGLKGGRPKTESEPVAIAKVEKVAKVVKDDVLSYGEHQRVKLTEKQFEQSLAYYGENEERFNQAIQILDNYLEINPKKKYANHSLVLKNWVKDEVIKKHGWLDVEIDSDRHEILVNFENCDSVHEVDFIKEGLAKFPITTQKQAYETWSSFSTGERFCAMLDTFNRTDIENKFQYALRLINDHTRLDYAIKKYKGDFKPHNPVIRM